MTESNDPAPRHRVPRSLIEQVFAGPVDSSVMATLRDGQHSRRLLLLKVLREAARSVPIDGPRQVVEESWPILVAADRSAPEIVREILLYPSVGTWLVRVIRRIRGIIDDDVPIWVDMGYLGSIASAAAIRAGIDVTATVPVWRGRISLPTVGQFEVGPVTSARLARLHVEGSAAFVEVPEGERVSLDEVASFSLRQHLSTAGAGSMCWQIDDVDPYRGFAGPKTTARLGMVEFATWCRTLDQAWRILVAEHSDYLAELVAACPVIVPAPPDEGIVASSSAASFGAIRVTMPETPAVMAETLLHELQHSKLNALLDLVPLQEPGVDRPCYAPWRRDPRPLSGLLHGIYAFAGVTEYWYRRWRAQLLAGGPPAEQADRTAAFHFEHHQEQVREALYALGPTPELTPAGSRLLEVAAARVEACDGEDVPADVRAAVAALVTENRLVWRLRHLAPADECIARLARLWLAGGAMTTAHDESSLQPFHRPQAESTLPALLSARALGQNYLADGVARPGERELARGDRLAARSAFAGRIHEDPEDDSAWVGLLMTTGGEAPPPEIVSATFRRIVALNGTRPDPVSFVAWFANG